MLLGNGHRMMHGQKPNYSMLSWTWSSSSALSRMLFFILFWIYSYFKNWEADKDCDLFAYEFWFLNGFPFYDGQKQKLWRTCWCKFLFHLFYHAARWLSSGSQSSFRVFSLSDGPLYCNLRLRDSTPCNEFLFSRKKKTFAYSWVIKD